MIMVRHKAIMVDHHPVQTHMLFQDRFEVSVVFIIVEDFHTAVCPVQKMIYNVVLKLMLPGSTWHKHLLLVSLLLIDTKKRLFLSKIMKIVRNILFVADVLEP
jgi:hypothetical protein